jgi:hypothetical protein
MRNESRFRVIERADPARFKRFLDESQAAAERRYAVYQQLAGISVPAFEKKDENGANGGDPEGSKTNESRYDLHGNFVGNPFIVGSSPLTGISTR